MTSEQVRKAIEESLAQVAPDSDPSALAPDADIRSTLELDSIDFLGFVEALGGRVGRPIDEADYPRLATMERAVAFLAGHAPAPGAD